MATVTPQEMLLVLVIRGESTPGPKCGHKDYVNEKFCSKRLRLPDFKTVGT